MAKGNSEFNRNMKKAMEKMRKGAVKGLRLGVALVKTESQSRTPVDEGNLKASHYTSVQVNKDNAVGEIGCTANYAAPVHEILENHHPVGEAKFLERAIQAKSKDVQKLIQKMSKVA